MGGVVVGLAVSATALHGQSAPAVIPLPTKMTVASGIFTVTARTAIVTDRASHTLGRQLARMLEPATGYELAVVTGPAPRPNAIVLRQVASLTKPEMVAVVDCPKEKEMKRPDSATKRKIDIERYIKKHSPIHPG